jgi:predicted DNA-binding transcriptional regulator AlpA
MKSKRPRLETGGAAGDASEHHHSTAPSSPNQAPIERPEAASPISIRDKLLWSWNDVSALTGLSRRFLEREVSSGRMPGPDVRIGRRACFRPATIMSWLDAQGGRP